MGSAAFAAQYQQRPVPPEGNLIRTEWLRSYDLLPEKESLDRIVQSWDCAAKSGELNDYSVCLTFLMRKNEFYLIDVLRQRLGYPELKKGRRAEGEVRGQRSPYRGHRARDRSHPRATGERRIACNWNQTRQRQDHTIERAIGQDRRRDSSFCQLKRLGLKTLRPRFSRLPRWSL